MESKNPGSNIPGPSSTPILGWLPWLIRFAFDPLTALEYLRKRYGDIVRLGAGKYPAIAIFHPDANRQIFSNPSMFYSYDAELLPIPFPKESSTLRVTTGVPLINGPHHTDHRAALLPFFHKQFITRYHDACIKVTKRKIAVWRIGDVVDIRAEMEQLAMWLGTDPVLGLDPQKEGELIGRQLDRTMKLVMSPFVFLLPYDLPGLPFRTLLKQADEMERLVRKVIHRKRESALTEDNLLSAMIRMHDQNPDLTSERELIGNTTVLFRAGYNAISITLYWTIFLLSQHPKALKIVLEELNRLVKGDVPTAEEVQSMPYLEGSLKEAMRLFPPGTWTVRLAMQDFELSASHHPKGTWVVMSPYVTHRIPELFPVPSRFLPERWLSIHPTAYEFMAFSAGPRYCMGTALAMMQLKIVLSIILKRYRFTLKPGTRVDCGGLNAIRPTKGLQMRVCDSVEISDLEPLEGNVRRIFAVD